MNRPRRLLGWLLCAGVLLHAATALGQRTEPLTWLEGTWDASYTDGEGAPVRGTATIEVSPQKSADGSTQWIAVARFDHPRTGERLVLRGRPIAQGDTLTIRMYELAGRVTARGAPVVPGPRELPVPAGTLTARLGAASTSIAVKPRTANDVRTLTVTLKVTPARDRLAGEWSYPAPATPGLSSHRSGDRGVEVWERHRGQAPAVAGTTPPATGTRNPTAEDVTGISFDPKTGLMTIARRNADGTTTVSTGRRELLPDGSERIVEIDEHGNSRETLIRPDGDVAVTRSDGAKRTTTTFGPGGAVDVLEREAGGASAHTRRGADGTVVTERRGPSGTLEETITERPDGWTERTDPHGNSRSTFTDRDGTKTTLSVDRNGNTVTMVTDRHGAVVRRDEDRVTPAEPGRAYFEQVLGGTDWDDLPPSLRNRYAGSERQIQQAQDARALREAQEARQRAVEAQRAAENEQASRERDARLATIRAEQQEADRRAADRQARAQRRAEVDASLDKGRDLRRQYREALNRGDQRAANRLLEEMDRHAEASMSVLQPTEDEQREMERRATVRQRVAADVYRRAADAAQGDISSDDSLQSVKDSVTDKAKWLSVGAEMQHETSRTTRIADRERAMARAKQREIARMLADPKVSAEERQILSQMQDMAVVQETGAAELLAANARLTAAGYVIDGALTATGGKLVQGGGRLAVGAAERLLSREAATRAAAILTERGVLDVAGTGATRIATGVTRRVAGDAAATRVGQVLAADVSTPAARAAETAARRLVGNRAVDAAARAAAAVAKAGSTNVSDIPGLVRDAVRSRTAPGEVRAAETAARDATAAASRPAERGATPATAPEAARPPRTPADLTPAERQLHNDARADEAVRRALEERRPVPGDAEEAAAARPGETLIEKPPSAMTPAERQAFNDRRAARAVAENRGTAMPELGDDLLPGPVEPTAAPVSRGEAAALHERGRNFTPDEIQRKAELYRQRERARQAARRAADERRPATEVQERAQRFQSLDRLVQEGRATRIERPGSPAAPAPSGTAPNVRPPGGPAPHETLAPNREPVTTGPGPSPRAPAGPTHGDPTMDATTLRDFATRPRVRTRPDPARLQRFSPMQDLRGGAAGVEARARWLQLPESRRAATDAGVRAAIDEAAAMGDKWARRLQTQLNDGTFAFSYEPGLHDYAGLALQGDHIAVNPFRGEALRSGDELASSVIHEFAHAYRGPRKIAADVPGFVGSPQSGKYNEVRAFLAEAIFNRNLAKARMLNGKPLDAAAAAELNQFMDATALAGDAPGMARGRRALANLQEYLVDNLYGPMYANDPAKTVERLSTFRGGSMENIQKYIREKLLAADAGPEEVMQAVLAEIERQGGRTLPGTTR